MTDPNILFIGADNYRSVLLHVDSDVFYLWCSVLVLSCVSEYFKVCGEKKNNPSNVVYKCDEFLLIYFLIFLCAFDLNQSQPLWIVVSSL